MRSLMAEMLSLSQFHMHAMIGAIQKHLQSSFGGTAKSGQLARH